MSRIVVVGNLVSNTLNKHSSEQCWHFEISLENLSQFNLLFPNYRSAKRIRKIRILTKVLLYLGRIYSVGVVLLILHIFILAFMFKTGPRRVGVCVMVRDTNKCPQVEMKFYGTESLY